MEPCCYQHSYSRWTYCLYIYSDCWTVCSSDCTQHNNRSQHNTNICCNTNFDLRSRNSAGATGNFRQWNYGDMESCRYQYNYSLWTYSLYIYSDCWTVCNSGYTQHNNRSQRNTSFCCNTNFDLRSRNCTSITRNFRQWN